MSVSSFSHLKRLEQLGLVPQGKCIESASDDAINAAALALGVAVLNDTRETKCKAINGFIEQRQKENCVRCSAVIAKSGKRCRNKARCKAKAKDAEEMIYSKLLCNPHFRQWQEGKQIQLVSEPMATEPTTTATTEPMAAVNEPTKSDADC